MDETARQVCDLIGEQPMSRVVAVWRDGSMTSEVFSFVERPDGAGGRVRPVATFVGGLRLPHHEVVERLERGLRRGYGNSVRAQ